MERSVIVVGVDESEHSFYALEWTLQHLIKESSPFKLVVVHAKPPQTTAISFVGPGGAEVFPIVDAELKKKAERVTGKAKQICETKSINDAVIEVVEGDARNVLIEAVENHNASILVVGSHGYGAIKRAVLGSVSDYLAHHAHCSVMIVKKPKIRN
ncbi:hypothetical protein M569_17579 [Genlisea aurea]|uniref:UspA domain-containing protein n=1 Tax=Genlisea aurea TaxID=192259 RepID=S8BYJ0_9LAMI|nr:hypothetical protein M569_17579 [Genlisea aurea]